VYIYIACCVQHELFHVKFGWPWQVLGQTERCERQGFPGVYSRRDFGSFITRLQSENGTRPKWPKSEMLCDVHKCIGFVIFFSVIAHFVIRDPPSMVPGLIYPRIYIYRVGLVVVCAHEVVYILH